MAKLGITVNDLKATKDGGITDITIATNLIRYAIKYKDSRVVLKIAPELVRQALLNNLH